MKQFQRHIENFTCEHCGATVTGNGYTNHCPRCLWSKHVDVNPGDRAAGCRGLMQPAGVELKKGTYVLLHRCIVCGHTKKNKTVEEDDFKKVIEISANMRAD